jgi:hypothetical protein
MKMMNKKPIVIAAILLLLSLSACSDSWFAADQVPWVGEEPVLFRDDFSGEVVPWTVRDDPLSFAGYAQSGFRLWTQVPDFQFWSVPGLNFQDTLVHVRARKLAGPDNNLFGLICRYRDEENFYALVIGSDGYYGVFKRVDGEQSLIAQDHMDFSEAINRGEDVNVIQAVCQGDQLALIVNETRLIQVQDSTFTNGDVGVIVGSFSEPGVDILFDDFIVVKP